MKRKPRILLLTPPLVQLNTPYSATPHLAGWLESLGYPVFQRDLSIETALAVLRAFGDGDLTDEVISFLQSGDAAAAECLCEPGVLPEGPAFESLTPKGTGLTRDEVLGSDPVQRSRILSSLYLDDLAAAIRDEIDPDFGFSRYAERLGSSVPDFGAITRRLRRHTPVDRILEELTREAVEKTRPEIVGVTCPFPGTLLGAFRIAQTIRRVAPSVQIVLGGGYVNTELREMDDERVSRYFDTVLFDEGYAPWAELLGSQADVPAFVKPSYRGLDLSLYMGLAETANPMHRLWSEERWLKLQLARGCYWHRCAFCDVSLDYIRCFEMPPAKTVVDAMERLAEETGERGFHFTDEAMPPQLVRGICREILRRRFRCRWWGNVRFDTAFTPELVHLMARAGCIAVTGGLECACNRLLKLMNKGITLESAKAVLRAFSENGIMSHAYLMYGFPTETAREAIAALRYVRDCFREGLIQSAFFHRFALTVHSPIAKDPARFGIRPLFPQQTRRRFALNEIAYEEPSAPDWERIGRSLKLALYNYMMGLGLERSAAYWFESPKRGSRGR